MSSCGWIRCSSWSSRSEPIVIGPSVEKSSIIRILLQFACIRFNRGRITVCGSSSLLRMSVTPLPQESVLLRPSPLNEISPREIAAAMLSVSVDFPHPPSPHRSVGTFSGMSFSMSHCGSRDSNSDTGTESCVLAALSPRNAHNFSFSASSMCYPSSTYYHLTALVKRHEHNTDARLSG